MRSASSSSSRSSPSSLPRWMSRKTTAGRCSASAARASARLAGLAAEPAELGDGDASHLRRLQYRLHAVAERVYGLAPPAGAATAHAELWAALAGARDATAEVAEALEEEGADAVGWVVHE